MNVGRALAFVLLAVTALAQQTQPPLPNAPSATQAQPPAAPAAPNGSPAVLDRNAWTFTNYDLTVTVNLTQPTFAVKGRVTLRNDSSKPQSHATLQISSTLEWKSIRIGGADVQYLTQPYRSDIDHTGSLSEAVVNLPREIAPHGMVDIEAEYSGAIPLDASRLIDIGTPANVAIHSDWDQITSAFAAVRGIGYVTWYPVSTEAAYLSTGDVFDTITQWKAREAGAQMRVSLCRAYTGEPAGASHPMLPMFMNSTPQTIGSASGLASVASEGVAKASESSCTQFSFAPIDAAVPTFEIAALTSLDRPLGSKFIHFEHLPDHADAARQWADSAAQLQSDAVDWFGPPRHDLTFLDLPDTKAAPFESRTMLFTPLADAPIEQVHLALAHQLSHASFGSFRPWLYEGAAHFAQAMQRERDAGRVAAIEYLKTRLPALAQAETRPQPLISATDEVFYRAKAAYVFWMLRDMLGDDALKRALRQYDPAKDTNATYFQRLLQNTSNRDLEWFFDDWVYRDGGLPDFRLTAVYARETLPGAWVTAITIENSGGAAAEVLVTLTAPHGQASSRLLVRAHDRSTVRLQTAQYPTEARVNDGSVPESDMSNNTFVVPERTPE
jgi:hypothetical protein